MREVGLVSSWVLGLIECGGEHCSNVSSDTTVMFECVSVCVREILAAVSNVKSRVGSAVQAGTWTSSGSCFSHQTHKRKDAPTGKHDFSHPPNQRHLCLGSCPRAGEAAAVALGWHHPRTHWSFSNLLLKWFLRLIEFHSMYASLTKTNVFLIATACCQQPGWVFSFPNLLLQQDTYLEIENYFWATKPAQE